MKLFLYRCPITGISVHGRADVDDRAINAGAYKRLRCSSCGRIHLIDPVTGQLLLEADEFKRR